MPVYGTPSPKNKLWPPPAVPSRAAQLRRHLKRLRFFRGAPRHGPGGDRGRTGGPALSHQGGIPSRGGPFDGRRVLASAQESMDRLGLNHLPVLYLHDPERITFEQAMAPDGPVAAMRARSRGTRRLTLASPAARWSLLRRFVATGSFQVVLTHNRWTLLDRSAEPLLEDCAAAHVAVVNGAPFGGGILAKGPLSPRVRLSSGVPGRYSVPLLPCTRRVPASAVTNGGCRPAALSSRPPHYLNHRGHVPSERYDEALALGRPCRPRRPLVGDRSARTRAGALVASSSGRLKHDRSPPGLIHEMPFERNSRRAVEAKSGADFPKVLGGRTSLPSV